jgi:hypothetical protein
VTIQGFAYLEVSTQKPDITFFCEISDYTKLRQYIWYAFKSKNDNTYYIQTNIRKDNKKNILRFHQLIKPEYKMIDHTNRLGTDNRECNLRETTYRENMLNRKLNKNNISTFNGISYHKRDKIWRFRWNENKKEKAKYFKTKEEAIEFKLAHDKITGNMNGKPV